MCNRDNCGYQPQKITLKGYRVVYALMGECKNRKSKVLNKNDEIEKSYDMFGKVENFVYDNELNRQVFKCFEHKGKKISYWI